MEMRDAQRDRREEIHGARRDRGEEIHDARRDRREEIREEHRRDVIHDEARVDRRREAIRREEREEYWDHWEDRRYRRAVGTVYTTSDFYEDDCEATLIVDNVTYYSCDGVWYQRAYSGGTVTYVVVDGPRGY